MDILILINIYLETLHKLSAASIKNYQYCFKCFTDFLVINNISELNQLTEKIIVEYDLYLQKTNRTNTRYSKLLVVRNFIKYLFEEKFLLFNITENLILPCIERNSRAYKYDLKILEKYCLKISDPEPYKSRNKLIVYLRYHERLLTSQIQNLSLLDLDLESSELRIKTKRRFQKLSSETLKLLRNYLRTRNQFKPKNDWLIVDRSGKKLKAGNIQTLCQKVCKNG